MAARRGHIAPQFGTFQGHLRAEDNPKMSSGRSARASCICWSALITFRQMAARIWEKLAGEDAELRPPPRIVIELEFRTAPVTLPKGCHYPIALCRAYSV